MILKPDKGGYKDSYYKSSLSAVCSQIALSLIKCWLEAS